jgi:precorrin-2 dehydrogenase/sirohydrochlorin ferrochelatase
VTTSFPVALQLEGKPCLVVGSEAEAQERARALDEAGARVEVVAIAPCAKLRDFASERALPLSRRAFEASDLDGKWLAVLTDRDTSLGARMAALCEERRVLFCATDQAQRNSFSHLALARAGLVTAAIGTQGRAPALGRKLREELERVFAEADLAGFADELARLRDATPLEARRAVLAEALAHVCFEGRLKLSP